MPLPTVSLWGQGIMMLLPPRLCREQFLIYSSLSASTSLSFSSALPLCLCGTSVSLVFFVSVILYPFAPSEAPNSSTFPLFLTFRLPQPSVFAILFLDFLLTPNPPRKGEQEILPLPLLLPSPHQAPAAQAPVCRNVPSTCPKLAQLSKNMHSGSTLKRRHLDAG